MGCSKGHKMVSIVSLLLVLPVVRIVEGLAAEIRYIDLVELKRLLSLHSQMKNGKQKALKTRRK